MDYKADTKHRFPGTLGIDIGSSSTRAAIHYVKEVPVSGGVPERTVYHERLQPDKDGKYNLSDFSSLCNLTGKGKAYIDEDDVKNEETTTIKLAVLLLTDADNATLDQENFPLMNIIRDIRKQGDKAVEVAKVRAREALDCLLRRILVEVKSVCNEKKVYIAAIGFTIPAHWGLTQQTELDKIFRSTFKLPDNKDEYRILCLFEIDAWARFYLEETIRLETALARYLEDHDNVVILFIDAGGFSMNTCIYHVFKKGGEIFHVVMDLADGITGGSGHWNYEFRQYCKKNGIVNEATLHALDVEFDRMKYTMDGTQEETIFTRLGEMKISGAKIISTWKAAHKKTVKHLKQKLALLLKTEPENFLILVSGGSSHHQFMRKRLQDICQDLGIPEEKLILTHHVDRANRTLRLAKGLNFALKRQSTATKYLQNGGGFAVQMAWATKTELDWDKHAVTVLDQNSYVVDGDGNYCLYGEPVDLTEKVLTPEKVADGGRNSHIRILGFPYATPVKDSDNVGEIAVGNVSPVYDLVSLGALLPGEYEMSVRYKEVKDKGILSVTIKWWENEQLGDEEREAHLSLDIYHYVSAGVVLCEEDEEAVAKKVAQFRKDLFGEVAEEARAALELADDDEAAALAEINDKGIKKSAFSNREGDDGGEFVPDQSVAELPQGGREIRPQRVRKTLMDLQPEVDTSSDEDASEEEDKEISDEEG